MDKFLERKFSTVPKKVIHESLFVIRVLGSGQALPVQVFKGGAQSGSECELTGIEGPGIHGGCTHVSMMPDVP